MHGAGTRTDTTINNANARLLDLTRLISRVGRGPMTGVDRVEFAYLRRLLDDPLPLYALVRTTLGYAVLGPDGTRAIYDRLRGATDWGGPDIWARLRGRRASLRHAAEADVRRFAIGRARNGRLARLVARTVPMNAPYFNVGHSNLSDEVFNALNGRTNVMVHDVIPLDHPEYQRPETVKAFEAKLYKIGKRADRVIYNSQYSRDRAEVYFATWGGAPDGVVAHLGIETPVVGDHNIPTPRPYFVTLGTIEPRKNHALLLDAWREMADVADLHIVGQRGWQNAEVFNRLDARPDGVFEWNNLSDAEVGGLIQGAAGFLFPSFVEGYGLPPAEALLLQTPVICAELDVYREFLGNSPVYLDPNDSYSWLETIREMSAQSGDAGKQNDVMGNLPTWDAHFNQVLSLI